MIRKLKLNNIQKATFLEFCSKVKRNSISVSVSQSNVVRKLHTNLKFKIISFSPKLKIVLIKMKLMYLSDITFALTSSLLDTCCNGWASNPLLYGLLGTQIYYICTEKKNDQSTIGFLSSFGLRHRTKYGWQLFKVFMSTSRERRNCPARVVGPAFFVLSPLRLFWN